RRLDLAGRHGPHLADRALARRAGSGRERRLDVGPAGEDVASYLDVDAGERLVAVVDDVLVGRRRELARERGAVGLGELSVVLVGEHDLEAVGREAAHAAGVFAHVRLDGALDGGGEGPDLVSREAGVARGELLVDARPDAPQDLLEESFGPFEGAFVAFPH